MGRTWRREERKYNKKKFKKGEKWDRNKRSIKEDEPTKASPKKNKDLEESYGFGMEF